MPIARAGTTLILFLFCICLHADEANPQKITITGTLSRAMAIGAETTGWILQVTSETVIDGKPISSIEVSDLRKPKQLDDFVNKTVKISGKVLYRHGVETGTQPYIEVQTIKEVANPVSSSPALPLPFSLTGTAWSLEGRPMSNAVHATLTFPETDKVAGDGSCNRLFGPAKITGDHIALGPLASSRMACPESVMAQETAYHVGIARCPALLMEGSLFDHLRRPGKSRCASPGSPAQRHRLPDGGVLVKFQSAIGSLVVLAALLGCRNETAGPSPSASVKQATGSPTDQWLGRWNGPEGTYLQISGNSGTYVLQMNDLDSSKTFAGSADGSRIAFTRDGKEEFISAGDGRATGMKWLSDKKNCLLTRPGEGWCRE